MVERLRKSATATIMIVDDQQTNLNVLGTQIKELDYHIITTTTAKEAIQMLEIHQPDVILLDIYMPEMDGFEVLKVIRQHPHISYIPVIMVTAQEESSARQQAYNEGADDFLMKPVDMETLQARLRVAVHLKQTLSRVEMERERFAFIAALSRELGHISSLSDMLEYIVDVCTQVLHASHGNLIIIQNSTDDEPTIFSTAHSKLNLDDISKVIVAGAAGHVLQTGKTARIDNVNIDPRWLAIEGSQVTQGSALITRLGDSEGPIGIIAVYHPELFYFSIDDQDLLELVARQITGLIRQTKLRDEQIAMTEQLSLQARQLRLVNSLAQTLSAHIDLQSLYEAIQQQMQLLLGSVHTCWFTFNGQQLSMRYSSTQLDHHHEHFCITSTDQAFDYFHSLDQVTRLTASDSISQCFKDGAFTDFYVVPLMHHGQPLGLLLIASEKRQFTPEDESLLEMARPHLSVALSTALMIAEREARQAEQAELEHLRHMAELAGQMAHHFNNLFAVILGNTQLAELDAVNEEQQVLLSTVVDQIRDGAAMIGRLYLLKGHKRAIPAYPIDLAETVPIALEHVEQLIDVPPVQHIDVPLDMYVAVQERELITMAKEIISNALEADSAIDAIRISAFKDKDSVYLLFRDQGQGIDEAHMLNIWRPFWTTHGPQRLGLGLPICAAVMWRIGGRLTVANNADGPGVTTTLIFPQPTGVEYEP